MLVFLCTNCASGRGKQGKETTQKDDLSILNFSTIDKHQRIGYKSLVVFECKWHSGGRRFDPVQLHHLCIAPDFRIGFIFVRSLKRCKKKLTREQRLTPSIGRNFRIFTPPMCATEQRLFTIRPKKDSFCLFII